MDETIKRYRACYFINGEKHYIRDGKFYRTIAACKNGIHADAYSVCEGTELKYLIEEYDVKLVANPQYAIVIGASGYSKPDVKFRKVN